MLDEIMNAAGISDFGVCDFADTLPTTGYKKNALFEGVQSVIVCLIPWDTGENEGRNMARYAIGRNYHAVGAEHLSVAVEILRRAFPDERFEFFIDSSPIAEVRAAVLAGLGIRGENNLLISEKYGTRCAIGEIITTRHFTKNKKSVGKCFQCMKCHKACPGGALSENGYDREKCVSYINQVKKELDENDVELIKKVGFICGCDCCTDVCPMNRHADGTGWKEFKESAVPVYKPGMDISDRTYSWKPDNVTRNYEIITGDK